MAKEEADRRSVHVGNVDYMVTAEQLQAQFLACGAINRVTIRRDHFTQQPKGYAYIEFSDSASVPSAVMMSETVLNGRAIKITPKRTNIPGLSRGAARGGSGGRGGRGGFKSASASAYYQAPLQQYGGASGAGGSSIMGSMIGAGGYGADPNVFGGGGIGGGYAAGMQNAAGLGQYTAPYRGGIAYRGTVRGGMAYPSPGPGFYRGSVRGNPVRGGGFSGYTPY